MEYYSDITSILYNPQSTSPYAFRFYNLEEVIAGKTMREQLKFAMSYWHTIDAGGTDMFGGDTLDKNFGKAGLERYKAKADFAFDLMDKLQIDFYCFHDADIAPQCDSLAENIKSQNEIVDYLEILQAKHGKKLLWNTANNFSDKRFMAGSATSPNAEVFALAAAKVKWGLDTAKRLGAAGYVFWGGREGYDTLLNTDMKLELDNLARFLKMAVEYKNKIGFRGAFYIEPKPKEPTKHQYDFDAATCMNFLRTYGLEKEFKLNIEANHATLAGHTFQHELRTAAINNAFGSIDANQGDLFLGWDTDQFPTNIYDTTMCMYEVLKAGGFTTGGLNFDAKTRRQSNTFEDILLSFIAGMDSYALGLRMADKLIRDGRIEKFISERYTSYGNGIGKKIVDGTTNLDELYSYALSHTDIQIESGRQEYLESILNEVMFGK
ncbi:MAG: xylose isomerase [Chloroflexi bacterium HGW-Chloroflexi-5]|nr:MAG: xylose isomerase [Chloroflexi bacterium HGW-Chloroflexi-5]